MSADDLVPPSIRERITVAPAPDWIAACEELAPDPATLAGTNPILLIDRRHHAGRSESYERTTYRLDTTQAVNEAAQWRLSFDPDEDQVTLHTLLVRRGDTVVEHARSEAIRLIQREEGLDRWKIDGWVTAVVLIEDVRVGDILDVSFTTRTSRRLLRGHFWLMSSVPARVQVQRFRVEVRFPCAASMRWKSSAPAFTPTVQESAGETVWTWTVEQAAVQEVEPGLPSWYLTQQWLQVSSLTSWGEVAEGLAEAWSEQFDSPELTRAAEEIAARADTYAERVLQALTFIQDEIRYLSVNTGLGGYVPAAPGTVLRRRFGDCKDKSFLAAHLLRRLGVPARAVLVSSGLRQTVPTLLPMPSAFDHVVVEYEIDGQRRWVDTTISQQGGGALARAVPDFRYGLPVATGVSELERQQPAPTTHDRYALHETFFVDTAHGVSTLRVTLTARGRDADLLRWRFAHDGADSVARQRLEHYRGAFPHIQRVGRIEWRDDRDRNEFIVGETYDAERLLSPGATPDTAVFAFSAHVIRALLAVPNVVKRRQPLAVPYPCNVEHCIEIESPAIARGENQGGRSVGPPFQMTYATTQQPGRYTVRYSLRTTAESVPPDGFASYQKKVDEVLGWTAVHCTLPMGVAVPWSNRQHAQLLPRPRTPVPADPTIERLPPQLGEIAHSLASGAPQTEPPAGELATRFVPEPAATASRDSAEPEPTHSAEADSAPRRRRRHRKKRNHEGLWIAGGILLIIIAGLAVVFIVGLKQPPPTPIVSGAPPAAPARPRPPVMLGHPDLPQSLPGSQSTQPVERSFFPTKPGPFSPNPAAPPPDQANLTPGS